MKIDSTTLSFYSCSPGKTLRRTTPSPTPSRTLNQNCSLSESGLPRLSFGPAGGGGQGASWVSSAFWRFVPYLSSHQSWGCFPSRRLGWTPWLAVAHT